MSDFLILFCRQLSPQKQTSSQAPFLMPPGVQINQLMCSDVPGDQPVVQFINILDSLKMPSGSTVTKKTTRVKLQITNNCHTTSKGSIARIEVYKNVDDTQPMWQTYLGSTIRCIAANMKMLVACCEDLSINSYNLKSGAKVLPPIIIEDMVSSLCISEKGHCMVLTRTGLLHMWDLEKCTNVINRASIRSLLSKKGESEISVCAVLMCKWSLDIEVSLFLIRDPKKWRYSCDMLHFMK